MSKKPPLYSEVACLQCGGQRVLCEVIAGQYGMFTKRIGAGAFSPSMEILAVICTHCGLVGFYAETPDKLVQEQ